MAYERGVMHWAFPAGDSFMRAEVERQGGSYQRAHLERALSHVKHFRTAVDGGAHVGTWAVPMAARFARVFAFEPAADTFAALETNIGKFGAVNVKAINAALAAEAGMVNMVLDDKQAARGNLGARHIEDGGDIERIELDSLDLMDLDFLKLDVEGSEAFALQGACETLLRCKPVVLFEDKGLWRNYGFSKRAPHELLSRLGAREVDRVSADAIWVW